MPGLGPGIHEFACADAQIAEEERAILCRWMSLFLCKLVDARAKPWHDGGEVARAGWRLGTTVLGNVACDRNRRPDPKRHPGESRGPSYRQRDADEWTPAFARLSPG